MLQLEHEVGDPIAANDVARRTAFRLAGRDPLGVARLAFVAWLDFLDYSYVARVMRWDRRESDYGERVNQILAETLHLDGTPLPHLSTATNRLYYASQPWLLVLAASPLLAVLALLTRGRSPGGLRVRQGAWIAAIAATLMGMTALAAMSPTPRFLHPLGWLAPIWMAELWSARRGTSSDAVRNSTAI